MLNRLIVVACLIVLCPLGAATASAQNGPLQFVQLEPAGDPEGRCRGGSRSRPHCRRGVHFRCEVIEIKTSIANIAEPALRIAFQRTHEQTTDAEGCVGWQRRPVKVAG